MMDYPGPTLLEIASVSRHNGNGYAVEIFVIGSDQASVILLRRGLMRKAGLDTKFRDIQILRGKWQKEADHYNGALGEAARLLGTYSDEDYLNDFIELDDDTPAFDIRKKDAFIDMADRKQAMRFQWAIEHLFSDAIFQNIMWELFPDMKTDYVNEGFNIDEPDSEEVANRERVRQYADTWGAF